MEVTAQQTTGNSRTYEFDEPITRDQMQWLNANRFIQNYTVSGKTLTINGTDQTDWEKLHESFIVPGLKKTFGENLKVNEYASASRK